MTGHCSISLTYIEGNDGSFSLLSHLCESNPPCVLVIRLFLATPCKTNTFAGTTDTKKSFAKKLSDVTNKRFCNVGGFYNVV